MASPRSAWASAGASLTPSPTIATTRPRPGGGGSTVCLLGRQDVGDHLVDSQLAGNGRGRPARIAGDQDGRRPSPRSCEGAPPRSWPDRRPRPPASPALAVPGHHGHRAPVACARSRRVGQLGAGSAMPKAASARAGRSACPSTTPTAPGRATGTRCWPAGPRCWPAPGWHLPARVPTRCEREQARSSGRRGGLGRRGAGDAQGLRRRRGNQRGGDVAASPAGAATLLVTGESRGAAEVVRASWESTEVIADVLPARKRRTSAACRPRAGRGDGRRRRQRAPALAQADLGIAIGTGADVAIEASESRRHAAIPGGRRRDPPLATTLRHDQGQPVWAFAYNVAALPLAAPG